MSVQSTSATGRMRHHLILRLPEGGAGFGVPSQSVCAGACEYGQSVAARDPSSVIGASSCTFSAPCKVPCRAQGSSRTLPGHAVPGPRRGARRPHLRAARRTGSATPTRSSRTSAARPPTSPSTPPAPAAGPRSPAAPARTPWGQWLLRPPARRGRRHALVRARPAPPDADRVRDGHRAGRADVRDLRRGHQRRDRGVRRARRRGRRGLRGARRSPPTRSSARSARSRCAPASARSSSAARVLRPEPAPRALADAPQAAVAAARGCLEGCLLVKANAAEARLLTGEDDPAAAAEAIAAMGVELVVVTLGPDGALARGRSRSRSPAGGARRSRRSAPATRSSARCSRACRRPAGTRPTRRSRDALADAARGRRARDRVVGRGRVA